MRPSGAGEGSARKLSRGGKYRCCLVRRYWSLRRSPVRRPSSYYSVPPKASVIEISEPKITLPRPQASINDGEVGGVARPRTDAEAERKEEWPGYRRLTLSTADLGGFAKSKTLYPQSSMAGTETGAKQQGQARVRNAERNEKWLVCKRPPPPVTVHQPPHRNS